MSADHGGSARTTAWTGDDLTRIGAAEEIRIGSVRRDGTLRKPVTIWVVRVGDGIYVRSAHGRAAAWHRGALARREGHIEAGGVSRDVAFVDADPAVGDRIDAAYREKYRRHGPQYIASVTDAEARSTTIQVVPR